jgi:hypothetical protein
VAEARLRARASHVGDAGEAGRQVGPDSACVEARSAAAAAAGGGGAAKVGKVDEGKEDLFMREEGSSRVSKSAGDDQGSNEPTVLSELPVRHGARPLLAGHWRAAAHLLLQLKRGEGGVRGEQPRVQLWRHGVAAAGVARDLRERAVVRDKVLPQVGGDFNDILRRVGGRAGKGGVGG